MDTQRATESPFPVDAQHAPELPSPLYAQQATELPPSMNAQHAFSDQLWPLFSLDNLISLSSLNELSPPNDAQHDWTECNSCRWWLPGLKRNRAEFKWQCISAHQSTKHVLSRLTIIIVFQWFLGSRGSCYSHKARHCIQFWCNEYKFSRDTEELREASDFESTCIFDVWSDK